MEAAMMLNPEKAGKYPRYPSRLPAGETLQ